MSKKGTITLATAVAASLFLFGPGVGFGEEPAGAKTSASTEPAKAPAGGQEEPYNIMGNRLILQTGEPQTIEWSAAEDFYWRLLFPLKTDGRSSGFFGYLDCYNPKKIGGKPEDFVSGPVNIKNKQESPFSADDFREAVKKVDERSLFIVIDLNQYYTEEERGGFNAEREPGVEKMATPIAVGTLRRFDGKYAAILPVKTAAGWDEEGFLVRIDSAGDLPVPPLPFDEGSSFVIVGDKYYRLEKGSAKTADGKIIEKDGDGTTPPGKPAKPPFRYEYRVRPFERKEAGTKGGTFHGDTPVTRGFSLSEGDVPGKELTVCLKIPGGDRYYAPAYVVASTKLYEGHFVSAVNTEYGSRLYFNTNIIDEYLKSPLSPESVEVTLIRGEDDAVNTGKDAKGGTVNVPDARFVPAKSEEGAAAQAFVTLDRQLKEGDRVKLEIKKGELTILTINEELKEVKGSTFKDERNLAVQALFENEFDAKNVRIKVDYSDFQPISVGRGRWFIHGDMLNSEANREEYVKGDGSLFILGVGGSRFPVRFNFGPSLNGSYFPNDPAEFRHVGFSAVAEIAYYAGDIAKQKDLWRLSCAPEGNYSLDWELLRPLSAAAPSGERVRRAAWKGYFPFAAAYSFDGVRFEAKAAPSYLGKEAREAFGLRNAIPLYVAVTASLDPKFVKGLPRELDSQSAVAVNFTYELGRDPLRYERLGNKFSLGFEYAPVKK